MITRLRRWIARFVALVVTLLTLGRVSVEWKGVEAISDASDEGGVVTALDEEDHSQATLPPG